MTPKEKILEIVYDLCLGEYGYFNQEAYNKIREELNNLILN